MLLIQDTNLLLTTFFFLSPTSCVTFVFVFNRSFLTLQLQFNKWKWWLKSKHFKDKHFSCLIRSKWAFAWKKNHIKGQILTQTALSLQPPIKPPVIYLYHLDLDLMIKLISMQEKNIGICTGNSRWHSDLSSCCGAFWKGGIGTAFFSTTWVQTEVSTLVFLSFFSRF